MAFNRFKPPKLPFMWLGSTFVAPVLVVVLPPIISEPSIPLTWRIIISLLLFSLMLIVSCIYLMLKIYDLSFSIQALEHIVEEQKQLQKSLEDKANKSKASLEKLLSLERNIEQRIANQEQKTCKCTEQKEYYW